MIKSTSTLRGEKLKDKEVRATKRVGKWSLGRGKAKERGLNPFFFPGSPKDVGQREKKWRSWRGLGRQESKGSLCIGEGEGKDRRRE